MKSLKQFSLFLFLLVLSSCSLRLSEKHMALGLQFEKSGQYRRALEEYQRVINLNEKAPLVLEAIRRNAHLHFRNFRDYKKAVELFTQVYSLSLEKSVKIDSMQIISEIYSEYLYDAQKSLDWQKRIFTEFGSNHKQADVFFIKFSEKLVEAGRYTQALNVYTEFIARFPSHPKIDRIFLLKGEAYLSLRKIKDAKKTYKEIIQLFKDRSEKSELIAEAYYGLGNCYEKEDDLDTALKFFKKSLLHYPNKAVVQVKIKGLQRRRAVRSLK